MTGVPVCYRVTAGMKTRGIQSNGLFAAALFGLISILNLALAGCVYRLPPAMLPWQQRLKVVARSPEDYVLRLRIREPRDYRVPADGRVTLDVPAYRVGC